MSTRVEMSIRISKALQGFVSDFLYLTENSNFCFPLFSNFSTMNIYYFCNKKLIMFKKKQVGSLRRKRGASISVTPTYPRIPPSPLWGRGRVLHFKKSDRFGEVLIFNKESGLVLEELESWQFMSKENCKK